MAAWNWLSIIPFRRAFTAWAMGLKTSTLKSLTSRICKSSRWSPGTWKVITSTIRTWRLWTWSTWWLESLSLLLKTWSWRFWTPTRWLEASGQLWTGSDHSHVASETLCFLCLWDVTGGYLGPGPLDIHWFMRGLAGEIFPHYVFDALDQWLKVRCIFSNLDCLSWLLNYAVWLFSCVNISISISTVAAKSQSRACSRWYWAISTFDSPSSNLRLSSESLCSSLLVGQASLWSLLKFLNGLIVLLSSTIKAPHRILGASVYPKHRPKCFQLSS